MLPEPWLKGARRRSAPRLAQAEIGGGPFAKPNPPHSHPHEQIGYAVEGELNLIIGDEQARVGPGDFWVIPGGVQHTVQLLTKTVRLFDSSRRSARIS